MYKIYVPEPTTSNGADLTLELEMVKWFRVIEDDMMASYDKSNQIFEFVEEEDLLLFKIMFSPYINQLLQKKSEYEESMERG